MTPAIINKEIKRLLRNTNRQYELATFFLHVYIIKKTANHSEKPDRRGFFIKFVYYRKHYLLFNSVKLRKLNFTLFYKK